MTENQNEPQQDVPGKESSGPLQPSTPQPPPPMEVHHHPHIHETKKWKEYVFQFFMLFLAVFLGFLAENLREHGEEKKTEKEYIASLVTDLESDRAMIRLATENISAQVHGIDSIQVLLSMPDLKNNPDAVYKCYYFSVYLQIAYPVNFNERTITQLLSSGNMRLLKTRSAADTVASYSNLVKDVDVQKQMYLEHINKCTESMFSVYDISYLRRIINEKDSLIFVQNDWSNIQLLTTDPAALNKLMATMEVTKLMIFGYKKYLDIIDDRAGQLLSFLKSEYHLKG